MADKEIYIAQRRIGLGTGVKGSAEINRTTTQTFDGPKNSGLSKVPHTLEISKLACDNLEDYRELDNLMLSMRNEPKTVTIKEDIIGPDGSKFSILKHYLNCLVDGDDYEMKAEEFTAQTLKFAAEDLTTEYPE